MFWYHTGLDREDVSKSIKHVTFGDIPTDNNGLPDITSDNAYSVSTTNQNVGGVGYIRWISGGYDRIVIIYIM